MSFPLPVNETERLAALRLYEHDLNELPDAAFDDLTLLAAQICETPVAIVSLVDESRQWFKSSLGLTPHDKSREVAFCAHTILQASAVMEVRDAHADPRFAQNLLVKSDPYIRFYAGAPLVAPTGEALGALCVMDQKPRALTAAQLRALQALSRRVVDQLELRRKTRKLLARGAESKRLLNVAAQSRRALLGLLEDEKRSGQNLRESETRFREIAENIQEIFWISDAVKQAILYISPAFDKIWGRSRQHIYDDPSAWLAWLHPDDRDRMAEAGRVKQPAGTYDEIYRIVRPDGTVRWLHDAAYPVKDAAGRVLRIVGTAQDITEHRQLETQLRQAQKMEAIGTLAGGIAHDFNNILGAIMGYAELAQMKLGDKEAASAHLASQLRATNRAKSLVAQILTFSRQQEHKMGLIQLRHVVSEPLELLRATIPVTIEFDIHLSAGLPAVMADATQIHQVVMNLGTNAWHAMRDRPGRLEVRLAEFFVSEGLAATIPHLQPGPHVRLTVSDTGHGMDRATLERIFEPFYTTKPPGEGTGLGLSVVHGIMRSHGGGLTVDSEPGRGTTFQLYFPAQEDDAATVSPFPSTVIPRGDGRRVLVVDNERALAEVNRDMLETLGYQVTVSCNASEALQLMTGTLTAFDLLITDLTMPVMTGTELAARVRQLHPQLHPFLPILVVTGQPSAISSTLMKELDIYECLPKPVTFQQLAEAVQRALQSSPATGKTESSQ